MAGIKQIENRVQLLCGVLRYFGSMAIPALVTSSESPSQSAANIVENFIDGLISPRVKSLARDYLNVPSCTS